MNTIYLDPAMVPASLRGGYSGKQFRAEVCETVFIPADAGLWSSGSRDKYYAIELSTGKQVALPGQDAAPWDNCRQERRLAIMPGIAIVEHSIFSGKDMGLRFYVHPQNAAALLPTPIELTAFERAVLKATAHYKASYNGMDRYTMALRDARHGDGSQFPTRDEWESAKQSLIARKLLNKAGAITVAGRNAAK